MRASISVPARICVRAHVNRCSMWTTTAGQQHIQDHGAILSQPPCRAARPCKATCPLGTRSRTYHSISLHLTSVDEKRSVCVRVNTWWWPARTDAMAFARKSIPKEQTDMEEVGACGSKKLRAREPALSKKTSPADSDRFVTTGIVVIGGVIAARSFATDRLLSEDEVC